MVYLYYQQELKPLIEKFTKNYMVDPDGMQYANDDLIYAFE